VYRNINGGGGVTSVKMVDGVVSTTVAANHAIMAATTTMTGGKVNVARTRSMKAEMASV
jgi:hypothetical protein